MRVGDIVRQGDRVIELKGKKQSTMLGTVISMAKKSHDLLPEQWQKLLGTHQVTVLWSNGRITENVAENPLEVVSETR